MVNRTCAVALIALGLTMAGLGEATAATRHATPTPSTGADCSSAAPCSLADALGGAADGDTILLGAGAGTYPGHAYADGGRSLTIAGAVIGSGRPAVEGTIALTGSGSRLTDVRITTPADEFAPPALSLGNGAQADRVIAVSTSRDGCDLRTGARITNSLCVSLTASQLSGLASKGDSEVTARNVTGVGFFGLYGDNGPAASSPGLTATDSIAVHRGAGSCCDVRANSGKMTLVDVAFDTSFENAGSIDSTGQVTGELLRSDTDFRQQAASPTIDAGSGTAEAGALDLDGNLRKIGTAVDLGAYEHVPAPPTATVSTPSPIGATTATVNATIDTKGGRATYRVDYGATPAADAASTATAILPAGTGASAVQVELAGLARKSTVFYKVVSETDAGETASDVASFQTTAFAPTATGDAATEVTATTATARGSVATDGEPGTARFVVTRPDGTTFATADQPVADGQAVSAALTGLAASRTYAYTLVVTTPGGTGTSASRQFTTAPVALLPKVTLLTTRARPDRLRRVTLRLRCIGPASGCSGALRLRTAARVKVPGGGKRRKVTFGRVSFANLKPGQVTKVRLRLSRKSLRTLRALRSVRVLARVTVPGGAPAAATFALRLKAPAARAR